MSNGIRNPAIMEATEAEKAYAAGFVDGEGSIMVMRGNRTWRVSVSIGSTDLDSLVFFRDRWGGGISVSKRQKPQHKPAWQWTLRSRLAYKCIEDLLPYLRLKKPQAVNALQLRDLIRPWGGQPTPLTDVEQEARRILYEESRRLNQRGC